MMKHSLKVTTTAVLLALASFSFADTPKKVAIVIPTSIQAMTEITRGFEETLRKEYIGPIEFKVANVQGDANLEHATLQELSDENYDIIAPVGTDATSMAISITKKNNIVSLASDLSDQQRSQLKPCNVAVVHDEISNEQQLAFIHAAYPEIKRITLFYSASEKIFPEVEDAKKAAAKFGISIHGIMAPTLPDLQVAANNMPSDTQAIFILKDSTMVSGIAQLVHIAKARHIPLITSDDGSVQNGAGFALGVHEKQIGIEGAHLAAAILAGKNACALPIVEMKKLTVFINPKSMKSFGASIEPIQKMAKKMHYQIENY